MTQAGWSAPGGMAGYPVATGGQPAPGRPASPGGPILDPGGDIRAVTVSYDDHFLRFRIGVTAPGQPPPPGMDAREFQWGFTYEGVAFLVDHLFRDPPEGGLFGTDYIGYIKHGSAQFSACADCVGRLDYDRPTASFFVDIETVRTLVDQAALDLKQTLTPIGRGSVLSELVARTYLDTARAVVTISSPPSDVAEDVSFAPRGFAYRL